MALGGRRGDGGRVYARFASAPARAQAAGAHAAGAHAAGAQAAAAQAAAAQQAQWQQGGQQHQWKQQQAQQHQMQLQQKQQIFQQQQMEQRRRLEENKRKMKEANQKRMREQLRKMQELKMQQEQQMAEFRRQQEERVLEFKRQKEEYARKQEEERRRREIEKMRKMGQQRAAISIRSHIGKVRQATPENWDSVRTALTDAAEKELQSCGTLMPQVKADVDAAMAAGQKRVDQIEAARKKKEERKAAEERRKREQGEKALALETHPDKGGDQAEFCRVRKTDAALVAERGGSSVGSTAVDDVAALGEDGSQLALPAITVAKDFQLQNHKELVKLKFKQDGVDLDDCLARQAQVLKVLGLEVCDVGATNVNEQGETIYNQCFYLSIARSYLGDGCLATVRDTALPLKRVIEEAVLAAHPDWQGQRVGEDVQAFSDFLLYVLGSNALLCELAVAIFDATSGGVEVYIGKSFPGRAKESAQRSNLLTIQYVPGHYRAFVPKGVRPSFSELKRQLDDHNVHYVPTYV